MNKIMLMYKYLLPTILAFSFMLSSCKHKKAGEAVKTDIAEYMINIDSIPTVDNFKMSSVFRKAKAILLEETDYAVIGEISSFQIFENYIFVMDSHKAKKLFIFNKDGKYLRQIGSLGQGSGEYAEMSDFCLDTVNREIYINDVAKRKLHKYNFETGKYVSSIDMNRENGNYYYVTYLNNTIYANLLYSNNLLAKLDIKANAFEEMLNTDEYNCGWNRAYFTQYNFFISKLDSPKFVAHLMTAVMSMGETGIFPYLTVKSKDWVTKSDILSKEKLDEMDTDQYMLFADKGKAFNIQNYMEHGDYIYFEYEHGHVIYFVVFNKINKEAYKCIYLENLENDLFLNAKKGLYLPFPFVTSKAAYGLYNPVGFELTENDIVPDLENREVLIESLKNRQGDEFFIILEYEFK
jgi:hypothetical protein